MLNKKLFLYFFSIFSLTVVLNDDVLNPLIEIKNKIKIKTSKKDKNFINFII